MKEKKKVDGYCLIANGRPIYLADDNDHWFFGGGASVYIPCFLDMKEARKLARKVRKDKRIDWVKTQRIVNIGIQEKSDKKQINKIELMERINKIFNDFLNDYNSPFIETKFTTDKLMVSKRDIKVKRKRKGIVSRGNIGYLQEMILREIKKR